MHPYLHLVRLFVALMAMTALLAASAPAQDVEVTVSGDTLGGYYRPGRWFPLVVTANNQPKQGSVASAGDAFEGRLVLESPSQNAGSRYRFVRDISVPPFSTLREVMYVRLREDLPQLTPPALEVRTRAGRLLTQLPLPVQPVDKRAILLATVSNQLTRLYYPNPPAANINPVRQANLPPRDLMTHWAGYDSLDVLVLPGWPDTGISNDQAQALRDWATMGGTVVFLGGTRAASYQAAPDNSALLPARPQPSRLYTLDLESLAPRRTPTLAPVGEISGAPPDNALLLSSLSPAAGAEVILQAVTTDGAVVPLAVRQRLGTGQIIMLATDFEAPSNHARALFGPTWMGLLPLPNVLGEEYLVPELMDKMTIATGSAARPPNLLLIVLLCGIYMIVVGPLNFLLLMRRGQMQLAWITTPAIVLIFSALIYGIGALTKGGESIVREVTVLTGRQGLDTFNHRSALGVFVQGAGTYNAQPVDDRLTVSDADQWNSLADFYPSLFAALMVVDSNDGFGFGVSPPTVRTNDDGVAVESWPLRTFDTTQFEVRGPQQLAGPVDSTLSYRSERITGSVQSGVDYWLEGSVTNRTGMDFYAAALVFDTHALELKPLKDGESVDLTANQSILWMSANNARSPWLPAASLLERLTKVADADAETDASINRRNAATLLKGFFVGADGNDLVPPMSGQLYFLGLAETNDISVKTNVPRDLGTQSQIVLVRLNPVPAPGRFVLPSELVRVRLQDHGRAGGGSGLSVESDNFGQQWGGPFGGGPNANANTAPVTGLRFNMTTDASATFCFEAPFESPALRMGSATAQTRITFDPSYQTVVQSVNDYLVGRSRPMPSETRTTDPALFSFLTGRLWATIESRAVPNPPAGGFMQNPTSIANIRLGMEGEIMPPTTEPTPLAPAPAALP